MFMFILSIIINLIIFTLNFLQCLFKGSVVVVVVVGGGGGVVAGSPDGARRRGGGEVVVVVVVLDVGPGLGGERRGRPEHLRLSLLLLLLPRRRRRLLLPLERLERGELVGGADPHLLRLSGAPPPAPSPRHLPPSLPATTPQP
uniref:Uncharacterized protein n=1 Tax=Oryza brachyantha TaxID=4533 RepID=J3M4H2_ORYBR